jgi:hypothetical protein
MVKGGTMLKRDDVILTNSEVKILWAIYQTLQEIKTILSVSATREQTADSEADVPLDELKRNDLMALIKAMPNKPDRWSSLSNTELVNLLRKEGA